MANYVRNGYRAIPELHTKFDGENYVTTVRIYQYPGELREIEKMEFKKDTKAEARKVAVAWVTENMARFKG